MNSLTLSLLGIKGEPIKLTRDQRRIFWWQVLIDWLRRPLGVVGFLGILFVPAESAVVAILVFVRDPSVPILHAMLYAVAIGILYPTAQILAIALGFRLFHRRHVREALRRIGYELCPRCGYNLGHGDISRACRECGWRRESAS